MKKDIIKIKKYFIIPIYEYTLLSLKFKENEMIKLNTIIINIATI